MLALLPSAAKSIAPWLLGAGLILLPILVTRVTQICWNNLSTSADGMHRIGFFQAVCLVIGTGCLAALPILLVFWLSVVL